MALAMTFVRLPVHEICAVSDWDGMKKKATACGMVQVLEVIGNPI